MSAHAYSEERIVEQPAVALFAKMGWQTASAMFDILTRPGPELSAEERDEVKKVARQLLARFHELLVLGWRQKIQARARVRIEIENMLDEGLPRAYTKELYAEKCASLFEHVFESYQGDGRSVFREAGL